MSQDPTAQPGHTARARAKSCTKCTVEKPIEDFSKRSSKSPWYKSECKACSTLRTKRYVEANRAKSNAWTAAYYERNKEEVLSKRKTKRKANH
jgi:hypothetical protein